jgi:hypothetical protein
MRPQRHSTASNPASGRGVHNLEVDLVQAQLRGPCLGELQHVRGSVDGQHPASRADPGRRGHRRFTQAGRHVQHALSGSDLRQFDHPVAEPLGAAFDDMEPFVPGRGMGGIVTTGTQAAAWVR